jgi:uncharacterized protein with HEPN domain
MYIFQNPTKQKKSLIHQYERTDLKGHLDTIRSNMSEYSNEINHLITEMSYDKELSNKLDDLVKLYELVIK